ncbi:uncharacterized protein RCO7_03260 [Rhynchosporium graminicola]|uniref:Uncharacterized protein n=1 Tax=Rhynchosporium graminicola TaxID=2792576 RepID=A0A1E1L6N4_9HELO|nr:uncharacterized protein RCO7_03260 [Rhynchosporium commune]
MSNHSSAVSRDQPPEKSFSKTYPLSAFLNPNPPNHPADPPSFRSIATKFFKRILRKIIHSILEWITSFPLYESTIHFLYASARLIIAVVYAAASPIIAIIVKFWAAAPILLALPYLYSGLASLQVVPVAILCFLLLTAVFILIHAVFAIPRAVRFLLAHPHRPFLALLCSLVDSSTLTSELQRSPKAVHSAQVTSTQQKRSPRTINMAFLVPDNYFVHLLVFPFAIIAYNLYRAHTGTEAGTPDSSHWQNNQVTTDTPASRPSVPATSASISQPTANYRGQLSIMETGDVVVRWIGAIKATGENSDGQRKERLSWTVEKRKVVDGRVINDN